MYIYPFTFTFTFSNTRSSLKDFNQGDRSPLDEENEIYYQLENENSVEALLQLYEPVCLALVSNSVNINMLKVRKYIQVQEQLHKYFMYNGTEFVALFSITSPRRNTNSQFSIANKHIALG